MRRLLVAAVAAVARPGNILWAEQDARISRGTTENIDESLTLWSQTLVEFKKFMGR